VQLFPERVRLGRRLILAAALLSLLVHLLGGSLWAFLNRTTHKPGQTAERVAKISPITIEQIPPTPVPTPQPQPMAPVKHAPPPRHVAFPVTPHFSVPTLAPEVAPSNAPHATIRHAPARVVAVVPVPHGARGGHASVAGGLTSDQISEYEGTFRKTIAAAQQAVASTPAPQMAVVSTMKDYNNVMHGSVDDIVGGEGVCNPVAEGTTRGIYTYYYLTCSVKYTDGFAERVSFPWPFKFTRRDDPFIRDDGPQRFPPQSPPPGFALPHPFALSRAVCMYFRDECAAVLKREQAGGGPS
jgi:hypothetical protein